QCSQFVSECVQSCTAPLLHHSATATKIHSLWTSNPRYSSVFIGVFASSNCLHCNVSGTIVVPAVGAARLWQNQSSPRAKMNGKHTAFLYTAAHARSPSAHSHKV